MSTSILTAFTPEQTEQLKQRIAETKAKYDAAIAAQAQTNVPEWAAPGQKQAEPETQDGEVILSDDEVKELREEEETKKRIEMYKSENADLLNEVGEDFVLSPIPPGLTPQEELEALIKRNEVLTDAVNAAYDAEEAEPDHEDVPPKYGHGLAVQLPMRVNGKKIWPWVDETGTNVDTGEVYNLDAGLREQLDKAIDKRRAEKAEELLEQDKQPHSYYAMSQEDFELESEKEYPVYILPTQAGPEWSDSILYGPSGDVIRKASQYNESHPAGMLVDLLVSVGSIIGRGPYFSISSTKHYTNEFMARVGDSSTSRKGTGRDVIDEILKLADPGWYSDRVESGFGSGEAIVGRIRDPHVEMRMVKNAWQQINVPGVTDKRLCIREGELASVFVLAGKPESRADIVLRDGWDGKPLRNLVKGKSRDGLSNSAKCEEPHISISGDTTISELRRKMPPGADENGFGNRFLYVYVYRVKDCPQGSPPLNWDKEILYFQKAVQFAKTVRHVSMTESARKWWNNNYSKFEHDGPSGLAGKFTSRGSAHLRRIAMLYALLDMKDQIRLEHFHAARRLWEYCSDSAMFIFGGMTREQLQVIQWVTMRGPVTFKQIRDDLYQRHKPVAAIRVVVNDLVKSGRLFERGGKYATTTDVNRLIS